MPGAELSSKIKKRIKIARKDLDMLLENANNQKNEFSKEISKQITDGIKKTKNVFELEKNINLNLVYLQKKFTVAKLVGYFDKLDLKKEFQEDKNPFDLKFDEAIKYFSDKEPTLFSKINEITEEVATNFFWIKKSTDLTVTKKIFENLKTSIDTGGTFKEWKENISDVLESTGLSESGYYLENVFRTNLLSAYNAGTYQQQMDNSEDFPYLMYDSVMDGRTTDFCTGHNGKIYKFDDKIWDIIYPPNHFGCRAGVISLSKEDLEDMGIKKIFSSTEKQLKSIDLKTFSGNPGKNYWKAIEKSVKVKENNLSKLLELNEERAIMKYKSPDSFMINYKLREDLEQTLEEKEMVDNLDKALKKIPRYQGSLTRSVHIGNNTELMKFIHEHNPKDVVTYQSYISTSKKEVYNPDSNIHIDIINSKNGRDISKFGLSEDEILYERDSKFKVLSVEYRDGKFYYVMEEVNE